MASANQEEAMQCRMTSSHWKEGQATPTYFVSQKPRRGHYRRLRDAIQQVPAYSRIEIVGGGVFREKIVIDKPIEIGIGKASDPPTLIFKSAPLTLQVDEAYIEGLSVEVESPVPSVTILRGSPVLKWCTLQAVEVSGNAAPKLQECKIANSSTHGLLLVDQAEGVYTKNSIWGHTGYSIVVESSGESQFSYNTVSDSRLGQICVRSSEEGRVSPVFLLNRISDDIQAVQGAQSTGLDSTGLPTYKLEALPLKNPGMRVTLMPVEHPSDALDFGDDVLTPDPIISNASQRCAVLVTGSRAEPTFTRNSITSCQQHGLFLLAGSRGTYEANYIAVNRGWGIVIEGAMTAPVLTANHIGSNGGGVKVVNCAARITDGNAFFGNRGPQLYLEYGHEDFLFERSIVRSGSRVGVWCTGSGGGTFRLNEFENCGVAMRVDHQANPSIVHNTFEGGGIGVYVHNGGVGQLSECHFTDHLVSGAVVATAATPLFTECHFTTCNTGALITRNGRGRFDQCLFSDIRVVAMDVSADGHPHVEMCKIRSGRSDGLRVWNGGRGYFKGNVIIGNDGAQVRVSTLGDPVIEQNVIGYSSFDGIVVEEGGFGAFVQNIVTTCHSSGVVVSGARTAPVLRGNCISNCGSYGVRITEGTRGTYEKNSIVGSGRANVSVMGFSLTDAVKKNAAAGAATRKQIPFSRKKFSMAAHPEGRGGGGGDNEQAEQNSGAYHSSNVDDDRGVALGTDGRDTSEEARVAQSKRRVILRENVLRGSQWSGITVERHARVLLVHNTLIENVQGVAIRGQSDVHVLSNNISNCKHGIFADEGACVRLLGNRFMDLDGTAFCSFHTELCHVAYNTFFRCGTALLLRRVHEGTCEANVIERCADYGMYLGADCRARVRHNVLCKNAIGICFGEFNNKAQVFDNCIVHSKEQAIRVAGDKMDGAACRFNVVAGGKVGLFIVRGNLTAHNNMFINCVEGIRVAIAASTVKRDPHMFLLSGGDGTGTMSPSTAAAVAAGNSSPWARQSPREGAGSPRAGANAGTFNSAGGGGPLPVWSKLPAHDSSPTSPRAGGAPVEAAAVVHNCYVSCCTLGGITVAPSSVLIEKTIFSNNDVAYRFVGSEANSTLASCILCNSAGIGVFAEGMARGNVRECAFFKNLINVAAHDGACTEFHRCVLEAPVVFNCYISGALTAPRFTACVITSSSAMVRNAVTSGATNNDAKDTRNAMEALQAKMRSVVRESAQLVGRTSKHVIIGNSFSGNGPLRGSADATTAVAARLPLVDLTDEQLAYLLVIPSLWQDLYAEILSWRPADEMGDDMFSGGGGDGSNNTAAAVYSHLAPSTHGGGNPMLMSSSTLGGLRSLTSSPLCGSSTTPAAATAGLPGGAGWIGATADTRPSALASFPCNRRRSAILWPSNMSDDGVLGGPGGPFFLHRMQSPAAKFKAAQSVTHDTGESVVDIVEAALDARSSHLYIGSGVWMDRGAAPIFDHVYIGGHCYFGATGIRRVQPVSSEKWVVNPEQTTLPTEMFHATATLSAFGSPALGSMLSSNSTSGPQLDTSSPALPPLMGRLAMKAKKVDTPLPPSGAKPRDGGSIQAIYSPPNISLTRDSLLDQVLCVGSPCYWRHMARDPHRFYQICPLLARAVDPNSLIKVPKEKKATYTALSDAQATVHFATSMTEHIAGYGVIAGAGAAGQFLHCTFGRNVCAARLGAYATTAFKFCRFEGQTSAAVIFEEGAAGVLYRCSFRSSSSAQVRITGAGTAPTVENSTFMESPFTAMHILDGATPHLNGNKLNSIHSHAIVVETNAAPHIERNRIEGCRCGMLFKNEGKGRVELNTFLACIEHAVLVTDTNSTPLIKSNTINDSLAVGIAVSGYGAAPIVRHNTLSGNQTGIALRHGANGRYIANVLRKHHVGISVDDSHGEFVKNNIVESVLIGVAIAGSNAASAFVANSIHAGKALGVRVMNAQGQITRNHITSNEGDGIVIEGKAAQVTLLGNELHGNNGCGVRMLAACHPLLCENVITCNSKGGVVVEDAGTHPLLEGNYIKSNGIVGVAFRKAAAGRVDGGVISCTLRGSAVIVDDEATPRLEDLVVIDNDHGGVHVRAGGVCVAIRCLFVNNQERPAFMLQSSEHGNRIVACAFIDNATSLQVEHDGRADIVASCFLGSHAASSSAVRLMVDAVPTFSHCLFALAKTALHDTSAARLNRCIFAECTLGADVSGPSSYYECELLECAHGIRVTRNRPTIMGSLFVSCTRTGLLISDEGCPTVEECNFLRCARGVAAEGNSGGVLRNSRVVWNTDNITIADNAALEVASNLIYDATNIGVLVKDGHPQLCGNTVFDNHYASVFVETANGGKMEDNNISFAKEGGALIVRTEEAKKIFTQNGNTLRNSYVPPPNALFKHFNERQQMYRRAENEREKNSVTYVELRRYVEEAIATTLLRACTLVGSAASMSSNPSWLAKDGFVEHNNPYMPGGATVAAAAGEANGTAAAAASAAATPGQLSSARRRLGKSGDRTNNSMSTQRASTQSTAAEAVVSGGEGPTEEPFSSRWDRLSADIVTLTKQLACDPRFLIFASGVEAASAATAAATEAAARRGTSRKGLLDGGGRGGGGGMRKKRSATVTGNDEHLSPLRLPSLALQQQPSTASVPQLKTTGTVTFTRRSSTESGTSTRPSSITCRLYSHTSLDNCTEDEQSSFASDLDEDEAVAEGGLPPMTSITLLYQTKLRILRVLEALAPLGGPSVPPHSHTALLHRAPLEGVTVLTNSEEFKTFCAKPLVLHNNSAAPVDNAALKEDERRRSSAAGGKKRKSLASSLPMVAIERAYGEDGGAAETAANSTGSSATKADAGVPSARRQQQREQRQKRDSQASIQLSLTEKRTSSVVARKPAKAAKKKKKNKEGAKK